MWRVYDLERREEEDRLGRMSAWDWMNRMSPRVAVAAAVPSIVRAVAAHHATYRKAVPQAERRPATRSFAALSRSGYI